MGCKSTSLRADENVYGVRYTAFPMDQGTAPPPDATITLPTSGDPVTTCALGP
jgi:hypothetical protein